MAFRVLLVNMPFFHLSWPSLGLSLLKAELEQQSIDCAIGYLNLELPSFIGLDEYGCIVRSPPFALAGEWVFAEAALGHADEAPYLDFIESSIAPYVPGVTPELLLRARAKTSSYLDAMVEKFPWGSYPLVGFSTMFEQTMASIALARRLKYLRPDTFVVLGGPNCAEPMGPALLDIAPCIDAVCLGEGDIAFPTMARKVVDGCLEGPPPGMLLRKMRNVLTSQIPCEEVDLNALPYPDYEDYFLQLNSAGLDLTQEVELPFESSRGCWWGSKHQCKFCGLVGTHLRFRSKSQQRALKEFIFLRQRYRSHASHFFATDNILDPSYFKEFLPELGRLGNDSRILYFTKANLKREQIRMLKEAGCREIQPGIESLSTDVLRLIGKGVDMIQNVQLLKWCREFAVIPYWNLLYGFPGESPDSYTNIASLIDKIPHLQPPFGCGRFRLERFSPYFNGSSSHGLAGVRPFPSYAHVYPGVDSGGLAQLAYYFEYACAEAPDTCSKVEALRQAVEKWRRRHPDAEFCYRATEEGIELYDSRGGVATHETIFGWKSLAYQLCDQAATVRSVQLGLLRRNHSVRETDILVAFDDFLARKLMIAERGKYLALAIPAQSTLCHSIDSF